jgi:hypothetical protein
VKVIERKEPPKAWWQCRWVCSQCKSVLEPETDSEIEARDAGYNETEHFALCPVCEERQFVYKAKDTINAT